MNQIPNHIAIIMDGNGRWAVERGMERSEGHKAGANQLLEVAEAAIEAGVKVLTLYAFSTENWKRPEKEVSTLMELFTRYTSCKLDELHQRGIRLKCIGRLDAMPMIPRMALKRAIAATAENSTLTLNFALNYGGRAEIADAVSKIVAQRLKDGKDKPVEEEEVAAALYAPEIPDPELMIRTGGDMRISNFLLWQISYSELYFTPVYWPDFGREQLREAIAEYQKRQRRFGKV